MSFNKKFVPSLERLKEEFEKYPDKIKYYYRADALIGSSESLEYLEEMYPIWVNQMTSKNSAIPIR